MTPIYRYRDNIASLMNMSQRVYAARQYRPDGSLQYIAPFRGRYADENLFRFSTIKDEIHGVRRSGAEYGRYPPGYCFQATVDLSKAIRFVDVPRTYDGVTYTYRVEDHPQGGGRPPIMLPGETGLPSWFGDVNSPQAQIDLWRSLLSPPGAVINALSEEAWNYFSDVLPTHLSFGEFVQGLTQLQDLLPQVGESITKTLSGGYLNKKFGWDNLLLDLHTLSNLFSTVTERMEYFRRTYGVPTRLGFSRHIDYTPPCLNNTWGGIVESYFEISDGHHLWVKLVDYRATFRATAWIMQTLDFMTDFMGFIRVLAGELGLNNPVKLFWQTLPLSFVVDWFFNVSTHLDNLTRLNPVMGWDVYDATQSVSYDLTFKVSQLATGPPLGYHAEVASWLAPAKAYERLPYLTFEWELLNPSELSETQLTLLLAMLHQHS